ncbi:hypothetical protein SAMN04488028_101856 [Reichenbachiella agariperforans]|uniref:Uncharacterized protein n=1 Tax=Reichenbachiella agariperforans TaxID=156994 RepID=A0A1M6L7F1_REIAG|nr:hypothetical protein [Reichenbachiella agariperforans]SHJ67133.1 hypothetical protein SAMN04488028_101856 [Reichenbachiella agariperforans]
MNHLIKIKSDNLFPAHFQILGGLLLFMAVLLLFGAVYWSPILLLIGGVILTTHSGVEFDTASRRYRNFHSVFYIKFGEWIKYDRAVKIYINRLQTSQYIYTRVNVGSTIRKESYAAYLKLSDDTKLYLSSNEDKDNLKIKIVPVAEIFGLDVIDNG